MEDKQQPSIPSIHDLHDANAWRIQSALDLLREASRLMQSEEMYPKAIKGTLWRLADAAGLVALYLAKVYGMEAVPTVVTGELTGRGFGLRIAADVRFRMEHNDEVARG